MYILLIFNLWSITCGREKLQRISGQLLPAGGTAKPAVRKMQQRKDHGVEQQHSPRTPRCCASLAGQPERSGYQHRGDAAVRLVGRGKLLGWERDGHGGRRGGISKGFQGVRWCRPAAARGQPSERECESIHVHTGQSQFTHTWSTFSKVGAGHRLPRLSYCNVLSAAKNHVISHSKIQGLISGN